MLTPLHTNSDFVNSPTNVLFLDEDSIQSLPLSFFSLLYFETLFFLSDIIATFLPLFCWIFLNYFVWCFFITNSGYIFIWQEYYQRDAVFFSVRHVRWHMVVARLFCFDFSIFHIRYPTAWNVNFLASCI